MANLIFYAKEGDATDLIKFMIGLDELAFIVSDGVGRWKAVRSMSEEKLFYKLVYLWHIASGPWPLVGDRGAIVSMIEDPWGGWQ